MSGAPGLVQVRRGSLYLSCAVCTQYFAGLETVILLGRGLDLIVLPVRHAAAGGYLLKRLNAAGDRVVFAPVFFREQGFGDATDREFEVKWDAEQAGLVGKDAFSAN